MPVSNMSISSGMQRLGPLFHSGHEIKWMYWATSCSAFLGLLGSQWEWIHILKLCKKISRSLCILKLKCQHVCLSVCLSCLEKIFVTWPFMHLVTNSLSHYRTATRHAWWHLSSPLAITTPQNHIHGYCTHILCFKKSKLK